MPSTSGYPVSGGVASCTSIVTSPSSSNRGRLPKRRDAHGSRTNVRCKCSPIRDRIRKPRPHVALRESIRTISDVGLDRIENRIQELAGQLASGVPTERLLSPSDPESVLVTIDVGSPSKTVERLRADGFVVRALPSPDEIRVSVQAVNTAAEIDALLDAFAAGW